MNGRPLDARVAVAEERLDTVEEEIQRVRHRLHELESDRAMLRLLADQVKESAAQAKSLGDQVESIAKSAAREAVELAMGHRDDIGRRRWGLRAQWVGVGIAAGGFVVLLADKFIH